MRREERERGRRVGGEGGRKSKPHNETKRRFKNKNKTKGKKTKSTHKKPKQKQKQKQNTKKTKRQEKIEESGDSMTLYW